MVRLLEYLYKTTNLWARYSIHSLKNRNKTLQVGRKKGGKKSNTLIL